MALNIAVPLSGVGGLSPISPIDIDCWEQIKMLVSPIGSESSGVSSLDSDDMKDQPKSSLCKQQQPIPTVMPDKYEVNYNGRNILDLGRNLEANSKCWNLHFANLPENNMSMYLANRSQYHRLSSNGHIQDYALAKCALCDFQYPINGSGSYFCRTSVTVSPTTTSTMTYTANSQMYNNINNNNQNRQPPQRPPIRHQSLPMLQNQNHNHSNSNTYNLFNNTSNSFTDSFLNKKTNITTFTTQSYNNTTVSSTYSSPFVSTSPTSSLTSGYSSSSSSSICGGNNSGFSNFTKYPPQQSPSNNNRNNFTNSNNVKPFTMPPFNGGNTSANNVFNDFCSLFNSYGNNSGTTTAHCNNSQATNRMLLGNNNQFSQQQQQQQPNPMYNYF